MRSARLESGFQDRLIAELQQQYPEAMIFKMDQVDGIPDLLILNGDKWASLECKRSKEDYKKSRVKQSNQDWYVDKMNEMSFSRFVYPENKEEVLRDLQHAFKL